MKASYISVALAALLMSQAGQARSYKRGVSENQFSIEAQMSPLAPGVSWYYNWANTPGKGYQGQVQDYKGFDFVPMTWNASYNADGIREHVKAHPECKYLLGFNEPNFKAQANMTPEVAAEKWIAVKALADELGLKLVAPALNYSPDAPYYQPTKWMDEFVALVGPDAFDYVAIHNYGGLGVMKTLATQFHEKYGKPVWVTEFCLWPDEGSSTSRVEPEVQVQSMVETVEWLEKTDWIYRYAWFKAVGAHENTATSGGPCYGLIISENGLGEKKLSPQGWVYTYMSDFDPNVWHSVGEEIPASEYIASTGVSLWPGQRVDAPKPIEISKFNAGATADYQIEVPADGEYTLNITVCGFGEPVRFDPELNIELVNADGTATSLCKGGKFTLPGSDSEYVTLKYNITLPAGKRTVRLIDGDPYKPSGIHISSLKLEVAAAVGNIMADEQRTDDIVYSVDGRRYAADAELAHGVYIRGGRKFVR